MNNITIELNQTETNLVLKAISEIPLAMKDPMYKAACIIFDKIKSAVQVKLKHEQEENKGAE